MQKISEHGQLLIAASTATFLIAFDSSVLYAAFPAIAKSFGDVSLPKLSWIINAYSITLASLLVPAGYVADMFGRKKAFLAGLVMFALGSVFCSAAPTPGFLIVARFVQGVGGAFILPSSLATLLSVFAGPQRVVAIGKWSAVGGIAAAIGPPAGAVLLHCTFGPVSSWRVLFLINAPICLAGFLLARRTFKDSVGSEISKGFASVMAALGIGIGLITAAALSRDGYSLAWRNLLLVSGIVFVAGSVWRICRLERLQQFFGRAHVIATAGATVCFGAAFGAMFISYSLALVRHFGLSIPVAGAMLTPIPLLSVPVAGRAGRLAARIPLPRLIVAGALCLIGSAALFYFALASERLNLLLWFSVALLSSMGVGLCFPLLTIAAVRSVLTEYFAIGSGLNQSCRQLGTVVGVAGTSVLLSNSRAQTFRQAMILLACFSGGTIVSLLGIGDNNMGRGHAIRQYGGPAT